MIGGGPVIRLIVAGGLLCVVLAASMLMRMVLPVDPGTTGKRQ